MAGEPALNIATAAQLRRAARELAARCRARGLRVAVAESCTGGWIAKCCTDLAGSSAWFERGVVAYSDAAKTALLGVDPALVARAGAVSRETVEAMAAGLAAQAAGACVCAVSGVAGPGGGSARTPVGCVWFAFAGAGPAYSERRDFAGGRAAVRAAATLHALRGLARSGPRPAPAAV